MRIGLFTWDSDNVCGITFAQALAQSSQDLVSVFARGRERQKNDLYNLQDKYGFTLYDFPKHNDGLAANAAKNENLDLIVISGDGILKPSVYTQAKYGAVNFHTGITPEYRGNSTLYWALLNQDAQKVGFTIHRVIEQVDSGPILYQEVIPIIDGDSYTQILQRGFSLGAKRLLDICNEIENKKNNLPSIVQDISIGREYRGVPSSREFYSLEQLMQTKEWQENMRVK